MNQNEKIELFIKMLSMPKYTNYINGKPDNYNIFEQFNRSCFLGYENEIGFKTSLFWSKNKNQIVEIIKKRYTELINKKEKTKEEIRESICLKRAIKAIKNRIFFTSFDKRIDVFIEMLSYPEYTGYSKGKANENNIFRINKIPFLGYDDIDGLFIGEFWRKNRDIIIEKIQKNISELEQKNDRTEKEEKKLHMMYTAKREMEKYRFTVNTDKKIEILIEKLLGSDTISKDIREKKFILSYEGIDEACTDELVKKNVNKIIEKIENNIGLLEIKENKTEDDIRNLKKYYIIREEIKKYAFSSNFNLKMEIFLKMMLDSKYTNYINGKPDENNIFAEINKVPFLGYEFVSEENTGIFWKRNVEKIKKRKFEEYVKLYRKENKTEEEERKFNTLQIIRNKIAEYEIISNDNIKIETYIQMLMSEEFTGYINGEPDKLNIFDENNQIPFSRYEYVSEVNANDFWKNNKDIIIGELFYSNDYAEEEYNAARDKVLYYINYLRIKNNQDPFNTIEEYLENLYGEDKKHHLRKRNRFN